MIVHVMKLFIEVLYLEVNGESYQQIKCVYK